MASQASFNRPHYHYLDISRFTRKIALIPNLSISDFSGQKAPFLLILYLQGTARIQCLRTYSSTSPIFFASFNLLPDLPPVTLLKLMTSVETCVRLPTGRRVLSSCLFWPILDCLNFISSLSRTTVFEYHQGHSSVSAGIHSVV